MKKNISILLAIITWFAVLTQYYLMLENRVTSVAEASIRFFSFFTILTNLLLAIYFTISLLKVKKGIFLSLNKPGFLTAITVYITIVGLVYQILLRSVWEPTGIQLIVDELLHTVIPAIAILFWYLYEDKTAVRYMQLIQWLIYPLIYLVYILIRGHFSEFYPYPFLNVNGLGLQSVLVNSAGLMVLFIGISALYIKLGKVLKRRE